MPNGQDPFKLKYMYFVAFMDLRVFNHPIFGTSIDHRHQYVYNYLRSPVSSALRMRIVKKRITSKNPSALIAKKGHV